MIKFVRKILVLPIKFYQKHISKYLKSNCPYTPTCSQYTLEAILKHGFFKGGALGFWRILRCNSFTKGGFDKVPDKKSQVKWLI
ncbi:MAG: membrane protein insertion efficiency factor YidD [Clostridia bacterium]|nr:membrane protein insertion efficiency factor YidD [Clostridia bacterium]